MITKRILFVFLLAALALALAGCNGPQPTPSQPPLTVACLDFEAPSFAAGNAYGSKAGQNPGDIAIQAANGVVVTVEKFFFTNGGTAFGNAAIVNSPSGFGSGQAMQVNNINLAFDFSKIGFKPSNVTLDVLDMGGFENLSVNANPAPPFAGELASVPSPLGGVSISYSPMPVPTPPVGKGGPLKLTGPVGTFMIGGQEFWIDNVCAHE